MLPAYMLSSSISHRFSLLETLPHIDRIPSDAIFLLVFYVWIYNYHWCNDKSNNETRDALHKTLYYIASKHAYKPPFRHHADHVALLVFAEPFQTVLTLHETNYSPTLSPPLIFAYLLPKKYRHRAGVVSYARYPHI